MLLGLAQRIQATELSAWLAGSTWAYPLIGALHVLGVAWFGGGVLLSILCRHNRELRPRGAFLWTGAIVMLVSGALMFMIEPLRCATSYAFGAKMLLLIALAAANRVRTKVRVPLTLTLWAGVFLAARGIAFF
jgi:hypothetical protein